MKPAVDLQAISALRPELRSQLQRLDTLEKRERSNRYARWHLSPNPQPEADGWLVTYLDLLTLLLVLLVAMLSLAGPGALPSRAANTPPLGVLISEPRQEPQKTPAGQMEVPVLTMGVTLPDLWRQQATASAIAGSFNSETGLNGPTMQALWPTSNLPDLAQLGVTSTWANPAQAVAQADAAVRATVPEATTPSVPATPPAAIDSGVVTQQMKAGIEEDAPAPDAYDTRPKELDRLKTTIGVDNTTSVVKMASIAPTMPMQATAAQPAGLPDREGNNSEGMPQSAQPLGAATSTERDYTREQSPETAPAVARSAFKEPHELSDAIANRDETGSALASADDTARTDGLPPVAQPVTPTPLPTLADLGLSNLGDDIDVIINEKSVSFRISNEILFESAQADLTEDGLKVLGRLATAVQNNSHRLTVEGHTDDRPIFNNRFPSNWELSTTRATSVLRLLQSHGVEPGRLRAIGYADTRPIASNDTAEGRAANRRVELIMEIEPETAVGR